MNDKTKTIALFAKTAWILYLVRTAALVLTELFPGGALKLFGRGELAANAEKISIVIRVLPALLAAAVFFGCWYLVRRSIRSDDRAQAQSALIAVIAVLVASPLLSLAGSLIVRSIILRQVGVDAYAGYTLLSTAKSYVGMISAASYPLLTAAAAMNWYRCRFAGSEAQ